MRTKAAILGVLGIIAAAAAGPMPTTADATSWTLSACLDLGTGGGFSNSQCTVASNGGAWAAARALPSKLEICKFAGAKHGKYNDPHCSTLGGTESFEIFVKPLLVKVTGAKYDIKIKSLGTIACEKMQADEPVIDGGEPTKAEVASLTYSGCALEGSPKCEIDSPGDAAGTVATDALESELVENTAKTKAESLFTPKTGGTYMEIELKGSLCALGGDDFVAKGSSLTEVSPQKEMAEKATLKSEPASRKYVNSKGEEKEAQLAAGAEAVSVEGSATLELEVEGSKALFGVFE